MGYTRIPRNRSAFAVLAVLLLACSGAVARSGNASTGGTVLYDQYNNASDGGASSQKYEAMFATWDDELADDFVVPARATWSVTTIDVSGEYSTGPASSFNVVFYTDGAGLPGSPVETRSAGSFSQSGSDFAITLDPAVSLAPGTYWVSVQANMNLIPGGQWYWTDRTSQSLQGAAWRNPADGLGTHCTGFARKTSCIVPNGGPDQVFKLSGTSVVLPPEPRPCIVPNVVGNLLAKAKAKITSAHCKVGRVTKVTSSVRKRGHVLAQHPKSGRRLRQGARINLAVGKGLRR